MLWSRVHEHCSEEIITKQKWLDKIHKKPCCYLRNLIGNLYIWLQIWLTGCADSSDLDFISVVTPEMYASAADNASTAPLSSINLLATALKYGSTEVDTLSRHLWIVKHLMNVNHYVIVISYVENVTKDSVNWINDLVITMNSKTQ